jgi:hypothetical protein
VLALRADRERGPESLAEQSGAPAVVVGGVRAGSLDRGEVGQRGRRQVVGGLLAGSRSSPGRMPR